MNTKTIFKTLAFAMMMPAMLLTTACSSEDDAVVNPENNATKSTIIPVTVNVTREDDGTRATYNESTKMLSFSTGDKLSVCGFKSSFYNFAGTLDYVAESDGTFSGTLTVVGDFSGTATELLDAATSAEAVLLPAGYEGYGYLSPGTNNNAVDYDDTKAFATSTALKTAKAIAVEQFSYEAATYKESTHSFALRPFNAILSFTIVGLTANATDVAVALTGADALSISKTVTTDASGTATFAVGVDATKNDDLSDLTLTVGGTAITLGEHALEAGKIYNIGRNLILAKATTEDKGNLIGADGKIYANADAASAAGTTAVAIITYVGNDAETSTIFNHGLALALTDASTNTKWCNQEATCLASQYKDADAAKTDMAGIANTDYLINNAPDGHTHAAASTARNYNSGTHPTGTSAWFLPSAGQWQKMITDAGSYEALKFLANLDAAFYWSSTEYSALSMWCYGFTSSSYDCDYWMKSNFYCVRSCLAF